MIKVYFGPYKHSPAPELQGDERRLMFLDFGLLRGVDTDFWTNNPMMLDVFSPDQIYLWQDEHWLTLAQAVDSLLPDRHLDARFQNMSAGRLALICELVYRFEDLRNEAANDPPQ